MATTRVPVNPVFVMNTVGAFMELSTPIAIDGAATWKAGQWLRRASDGLMYESITSANSGVGDDMITHMAPVDLGTAIGADTTFRKFYINKSTDVFELNENSSAAATLAQVGTLCGIIVSSNVTTFNIAETTHTVIRIVDPCWDNRPFEDGSTDLKPRWLVSPREASINGVPTN